MSYYTASGSLRWPEPGPSDVPSYQLSAIPFVTTSQAGTVSPLVVEFPTTTRWVQVVNTSGNTGDPLHIGFTENGVSGNPDDYRFSLPFAAGANSTARWELRVSKMYFLADTNPVNFSLIAGLSPVPSRYFDDITGSLGGVYGGIG